MLRFAVIAVGALLIALLDVLKKLALWTDSAAGILYCIAIFAMALAYGLIGDNFKKNKAPLGKRFICAWATYGLILTGALRLPFGNGEQWKLTLGLDRDGIAGIVAAIAVLGMAFAVLAVLKRDKAPVGYRGKVALMLACMAGMLICGVLLLLGHVLPLPAFVGDWGEPLAFLLAALESGAAFLILQKVKL